MLFTPFGTSRPYATHEALAISTQALYDKYGDLTEARSPRIVAGDLKPVLRQMPPKPLPGLSAAERERLFAKYGDLKLPVINSFEVFRAI